MSAVGDVLTTCAELDALPLFTVLLADPSGKHEQEQDRRLSMQKRVGVAWEPWWFPAWEEDWVVSSVEAVGRFHLGPFLVLWLPDDSQEAESLAYETGECPAPSGHGQGVLPHDRIPNSTTT